MISWLKRHMQELSPILNQNGLTDQKIVTLSLTQQKTSVPFYNASSCLTLKKVQRN